MIEGDILVVINILIWKHPKSIASKSLISYHLLFRYCFDVLKQKLDPNFKSTASFQSSEKLPLFVTWQKKVDENSYALRGCIGTFRALNLEQGLREFALTSAFDDNRFSPISKEELPSLKVGVSLLVKFEPNKKYMEWNVGQHGIIINFNLNGRAFQATYLPEVAQEQEWTKKQAIDSLIKKAGYEGNVEDIYDKIVLTTYESSKCSLTYQEYIS